MSIASTTKTDLDKLLEVPDKRLPPPGGARITAKDEADIRRPDWAIHSIVTCNKGERTLNGPTRWVIGESTRTVVNLFREQYEGRNDALEQLSKARGRVDELEALNPAEEYDRLQNELDKWQGRYNELTTTFQTYKKEVEQAETHNQQVLDTAEEAVKQGQKKIAEAEQKTADKEKARATSYNLWAKEKEKTADITARLREYREEADEERAHRARLDKELSDLKISSSLEIGALQGQVRGHLADHSALNILNAKQTKLIQDLRDQLDDANNTIVEYEFNPPIKEDEDRKDREIETLQQNLQNQADNLAHLSEQVEILRLVSCPEPRVHQ